MCNSIVSTVIKETGIASLGFMGDVTFELGLGEWVELGLPVMREGQGRRQEK